MSTTESSHSTDPQQARPASEAERHPLLVDLGSWGPVIAFVLVIAIFGALKGSLFLSSSNIFSILNDNAVLAILACGLTVVLLCGEFDLSIASNLTLTGALCAGLMAKQGLPVAAAVALALLAGAVISFVNGALVVYFRINALIATLAVGSILDGLTQAYTGGSTIFNGIPHSFIQIGRAGTGELTIPILYMVIIAFLLWFALRYTMPGRYMHAIGGNRDAARLSGVRVGRYVIIAFVISGICAAIAGVVQTARNGAADPTAGATFLLPAFAAAFLGSATLRRGEFHIAGTILGVYLIAAATSGFFLLGAAFYTQQFLSGGLLILATASSRFLGRGSAVRLPVRKAAKAPPSVRLGQSNRLSMRQ